MHACMYVCTCVCVYTYTYTHTYKHAFSFHFELLSCDLLAHVGFDKPMQAYAHVVFDKPMQAYAHVVFDKPMQAYACVCMYETDSRICMIICSNEFVPSRQWRQVLLIYGLCVHHLC